MNMKKQYIKPQTEVEVTQIKSLLAGHSNDFVGAKENSFDEEEKESNYLKDIQFKDIWEDEEE